MKKVRIQFGNMRKGDVFVADCDGVNCIVERPRSNMGRLYQSKHRNQVRKNRAFAVQATKSSVDEIMKQLDLVM